MASTHRQGNIGDIISHLLDTLQNNKLIIAIAGAIVGAFLMTIAFFSRQLWYAFIWLVSWVWATIHKQGKDHAFEKAYLNWLINQHRYLGLLPANTVTTRWGEGRRIVDLEKVYVTLSLTTQHEDQDWIQTSEDSSSWRKQPWFYRLYKRYLWIWISGLLICMVVAIFTLFFQFFSYVWLLLMLLAIATTGLPISNFLLSWRTSQNEKAYQPGDLGLAIDKHKQLIIRGDPGSGKTTLLRYLAVTCARALRADKKKGDQPNIVKKRLLWNTRPFPILVTLRRYSNVATWDKTKDLTHAFLEEISTTGPGKKCPEGFFERQLKKGNCLILLDAFDELSSPQARMEMAHRIAGFLNTYNQPSNRIVVTTRIVGYEGQLDLYGFQIRTIQKLKEGETRALVKQRYHATALSETTGRKPHDAAPIIQDMQQRAAQLIKKIESTPRLAELATNPLLLSLVVLIHYVKIKLPEQRALLYRDCVEILTEQWQRSKFEETGGQQYSQEELTLAQKLVLLQEIALTMQQKREEENRETLLPRAQVQDIIARKLPDILGNQLPTSDSERSEVCHRKAEEWIRGVQLESGILVEQGLDEAGNPLVGFSHLTFQEYLTAVVINEDSKYQSLLRNNLLEPTWREVVLLYVALTNDATPTIATLVDTPMQPDGLLLAGSCLAEQPKYVKHDMRQLTIQKLKEGFDQANEQTAEAFGKVLAAISTHEVTIFILEQLQSPLAKKRLIAARALRHTKADDPQIEQARENLVELVETPNDVDIVVAARESLAQIGDPRFTGKEPRLVHIPQQSCSIPSSPKTWKELVASPKWTHANLLQKWPLITRVLDYKLFTKIHPLRKQLPQMHEFEIDKYLVTNIEYASFIKATKHPYPKHWIEGAYPTEKATHPVTGITLKDAQKYCKWLTQETGKKYRLPTEWEWEWAATGHQGQKYPWGDQFDKDKCNTMEAKIGETTPVGSYLIGASEYGATDMIGNVWDITRGYYFSHQSSSSSLNNFLLIIVLIMLYIYAISFFRIYYFINVSLLILLGIMLLFLLGIMLLLLKMNGFVLRGGSIYTSSGIATCFDRDSRTSFLFFPVKDRYADIGFRCVREL